MVGMSAHATEMCARNDTVVIPLDGMITKYVSNGYNIPEWLWWIKHDYGTIYGTSTCLSQKEIMMYSDWNGSGWAPSILNTADDELAGASGYYMNADINPDIPDAEKNYYSRYYCYVKLTHPMSSNWVMMNSGGSNVSNCHTLCVTNSNFYSLSGMNDSVLYRGRLFNSIGTQPPWEEE